MDALIVLHIGAGQHALTKDQKYKTLIKQALSTLDLNKASEILERSPSTNTGYGASLNWNGEVRCDASFIHDNGRRVQVGSMYNISHCYPIRETIDYFDKLEQIYQSGPFSTIGLRSPIMLDYSQAELLGKKNEISGNERTSLVSPKAKYVFDSFKNRLRQGIKELEGINIEVQDTIGIISIKGIETKIAASSGGNFFKLPGRIGCAAIVGTGIAFHKYNDLTVSCLCSGNGEDIIKMGLAARVVETVTPSYEDVHSKMLGDIVSSIIEKVQLQSTDEGKGGPVNVGVICVTHEHSANVKRLLFCHNTPTFYFGFNYNGTMKVVLSKLKIDKVTKFMTGEYNLSK